MRNHFIGLENKQHRVENGGKGVYAIKDTSPTLSTPPSTLRSGNEGILVGGVAFVVSLFLVDVL